MSEPYVFDSRHPSCKTPYGAVPCTQTITLTTRPHKDHKYTRCAVVMRGEFTKKIIRLSMICEGLEGDRLRFSVTFQTPEQGGLIWYSFHFWRDDGTGDMLDKTGYCPVVKEPWQLTVYAPSYKPDWFAKGITYQIFPDRFHRLSIPDPTGMVGERTVHQKWGEDPAWKPDAEGIVRNRDFFGGSIPGIIAKLPYLKSLNVTTLYLCPVFESASNHRYNTADYTAIDPMLGTEEDFKALCDQAHALGMYVILDGVFNHIGSQSRYFNQDGFYPTLGAAQSQNSPWYPWFRFSHWPDEYESWWGITTLPAVEEHCIDYVNFIIKNPDSIIRRWLHAGADGWRLDVADELPDKFIAQIRTAMEEVAPESLLLGEVWEDASNKVAYGECRKYFLGQELHGVMNYPFRTATMNYLKGHGAQQFVDAMEQLREHYPPDAFYCAMNFLGTHDTGRILTTLGATNVPEDKEERADYTLSLQEYTKGRALVSLAALILYTFPGSPTVYYGDEVGMEGFEDPFNRGTYPWGNEDRVLLAHFTQLGKLRMAHPALQEGDLYYTYVKEHVLGFSRKTHEDYTMTLCNASEEPVSVSVRWEYAQAVDALSQEVYEPKEGVITLVIPPYSGVLLTP